MQNISTIKEYVQSPFTKMDIENLKSELIKQEKKTKGSKIPWIFLYFIITFSISYVVYLNTYEKVLTFDPFVKFLFIATASFAIFGPLALIISLISSVKNSVYFSIDELTFSSDFLEIETNPLKDIYESTDISKILSKNIKKQNRSIYKFEYELMKHTKYEFEGLLK